MKQKIFWIFIGIALVVLISVVLWQTSVIESTGNAAISMVGGC